MITAALSVRSSARAHYKVLTPEELRERGKWTWPVGSVGGGTHAVAVALAARGYVVIEEDLENGIVRTEPHAIGTAATGGVGYASTAGDQVAWTIHVVDVPSGGIEMQLEPSVYRGRTVMADYVFVAELMDPMLDDLRHHVERAIVRARGTRR